MRRGNRSRRSAREAPVHRSVHRINPATPAKKQSVHTTKPDSNRNRQQAYHTLVHSAERSGAAIHYHITSATRCMALYEQSGSDVARDNRPSLTPQHQFNPASPARGIYLLSRLLSSLRTHADNRPLTRNGCTTSWRYIFSTPFQ